MLRELIRNKRVPTMFYHFAEQYPEYLSYYIPQLIRLTFAENITNFDVIDNFVLHLKHQYSDIKLKWKLVALSALLDEINKLSLALAREKSLLSYRLYEIQQNKLYKTHLQDIKSNFDETIKKLPLGIQYL